MSLRACLMVIFLTTLFILPANAGPVFEDILNAMQIDQRTPPRTGDEYKIITRDKPIGQTFVTGDSVTLLCRIAMFFPFWHEDWQPDETLVLTLWDSLEKKITYGRFDIPYYRRQWNQGMLMFSVESKVEPRKSYYFELTVEGGDGKIIGPLACKGDYTEGQAYEGGKTVSYDLWFETHVKKVADRDANYTEFFDDFNLDHPGMEKVRDAVKAKNWDTACSEFLIYMESKKELFNDEDATPKLDPTFNTKEADLAALQKWEAQDGSIVDLGPNWNYFATWPTLGGVGLTRTGLMKPLAFTYTRTGNDKYARAWNDMLISMFRNVPSPLKSGVITVEGKIKPTIPAGISGCLWDSISLAARMHHETFYNRFRKSPLFEPDVRMAWWANVADMVNTLERMDAGGNWTTQNMSSLFSFAQKYPEFKKANAWFKAGFEGLTANLMENMYPDGPCREATTGYHSFCVGMFFGSIKRAKEMGLDVPDDVMQRLEKTFDYVMYSTKPDWKLPLWGDTNPPQDQCGLLQLGAGYFNRKDMQWVGTKGKEGNTPSITSLEFPTAGYYIMRSGWDPAARYLVTRNGFSQSHYHSDNLGLTVYAYGNDLLADPGVYTYGTPECNELVKTKSHSTIGIDGKDIAAGNGINNWCTLPGMDYFDGISPGYHDLKDVKHQRTIVFVKPDYWVIADRVTGEGEHTVSQFWHFAPAKVDLDNTSGEAATANSSGGNLAVIPLQRSGVKSELYDDLFADSWTTITKAPVVKHEINGQLPMSFCTVLYPSPAGSKADIQTVELKHKDASLQNKVFGTRVDADGHRDYIIYNSSDQEVELAPGNIKSTANTALVRTDSKTGKVTSFSWFSGKTLSIGKTALASSDEVVRGLSVSYAKDTVTVNAEGSPKSLNITTLGAKTAIVNGKQIKLPKGAKTFRPF